MAHLRPDLERLAERGLYDARDEHDACGLGFVVDLKGGASHRIVEMGLEILRRLAHRGAAGSDATTGDGAGILVQIPHRYFERAMYREGREIPPAGGDTMFANMYLAYESLSPGMRATLDRLKALNSGDKKRGGGTKNRAERYSGAQGMKLKDPGNIQTDSVHPLVRTHADTGRKGLYLGSHTQHLDGFTPEESEPILSFLREHCRRPEYTCRFHWAPGSLAIWDNRCVQHYAINDYAGYRRRMHRITIKGEDAPF